MQHLEVQLTPDDLDVFNNEVVYGCYELQDQKRVGKIATLTNEIYNGSGILDIEVNDNILYASTSDGNFLSFRGKDNYDMSSLFLESGINLTLSVNNNLCCVSNNHGNVFLLDLASNIILDQFKAHSLEIWSCCWNSKGGFLTGADDCMLKLWDKNHLEKAQWSKRMEMGVSCISNADNNVLIGNYDEKLRLLDLRMPEKFVQELDCGGGIWRIKQNPVNPNIFLIAAMHGGAHVVNIQSNEILQSFSEHDSMVYGAAWLNETQIATCSFYDKKLAFWTWIK